MNRLGGDGGAPLVVIDYAHTPTRWSRRWPACASTPPARLVCVFGCGGERDRGKRPQMARDRRAPAPTRVIVTDDNPRGEDGDAIVADILAGFADAASA